VATNHAQQPANHAGGGNSRRRFQVPVILPYFSTEVEGGREIIILGSE
jgi:hypothetical protein